MKRIFTASLTLLLLIMSLLPAGAAFAAVDYSNNYYEVSGVVSSVERDGVLITKPDASQLLLKVDKSSYIIDNASAKACALSAIRVGTTLRAWHSEVVTMSLPAQSHALAMVVNLSGAETVVANLYQVESVSAQKDGYSLLNTQKNLYLNVQSGIPVRYYANGKATAASKLQKGDLLMAWYGLSTASYPAQAAANAVLILRGGQGGGLASANGNVAVSASGVVSVNGKKIKGAAFTLDNTYMVPLRKTAEALGFKCYWNKKTQTMTLSKKGVSAAFAYDNSLCSINGASYTLTAPQMAYGTLFADVQAFTMLGYKVSLPNG